MIAERPFILYSLPTQRMNQRLKDGNNIQLIWDRVNTFLDKCAIQTDHFPNFEVYGYSGIEGDVSFEETNRVIDDLFEMFGKPKTTSKCYHIINGKEYIHPYYNWEIKKSKLNDAIDYILKKPWNKKTKEPILMIVTFGFYFKDTITNIKLPNQQYGSQFSIWLSKTCSVCPDLFIPFEGPTDQFESYMKQIEEYLPFKIEEKQYRIGQANKKGTANRFIKFEKYNNTHNTQ